MKNKKSFLYAILSMITISSLVACSSGKKEEEWEEPVYEVGDTVKEWTSNKDFNELPMGIPEGVEGTVGINNELGNNDNSSLFFDVKGDNAGSGYIASDVLEKPFFTDDDVKNGDIISLFVYAPGESNVDTLLLEAIANDGSSFTASEIKITSEKEEQWIASQVVFDTLSTLSSIRLNYTASDASKSVKFYVDNINITYGDETQQTGYVNNGESLKKQYEDYNIRIGTCLSADTFGNTKMRQIVKEHYNSLTTENECKPQHTLDQAACQKLTDKTQVVIKTDTFEKMFDWCETHHIPVRYHTLVWYSQTPDWFFKVDYANGANASREVMLKRLDNFTRVTFDTINSRWPGLIYAVDVANEAIENGGAGYNKGNKWFDTIGEDFVYQAFKYAAMYKEDYQDLYYNDYACDYNTSKCEFALNGFLKNAIDEGLVDGFGLQGHIDCDNVRQTLANAKLIYSRGLKCQITELDITTGSSASDLEKQKKAYKDLFGGIIEGNQNDEMEVNAVVLWGVADDYSRGWRYGQNPLLFANDFTKKPAYFGVLEALDGESE